MADNFSPPRPPARPAGLASRPAPREEKKTGFMESIRSFFSSEDDDTDTYVKARDGFYMDPEMYAMENATTQLKEEREKRETQSITQQPAPYVSEPEAYTPEVVKPESATPEVVKPESATPEVVEPDTADTNPEVVATPPVGGGLMSPKTLTDLVYDDFVLGKQEGDEAHVGQDNKNITLAGGVVPDGLIYEGKAFTQDKAVVVGFDKTKLDTSNAYKKVGNVTVKRSDFDSDKAFAKGVIKEFIKQAKAAAGNDWDKISEGPKKAIIKIGWNKGAGWYAKEEAKAIYKELAKDKPNASNLYSKILTGSTVAGGGASIGLAKARANAWNETISATGGKEIVKIVADNSGANTAFKYYDKDGNLLHTEQTSRASTIYANKGRLSISKNSAGAW